MSLKVNNLSFAYGKRGEDVLTDINFEMTGTKLGLIGSSGSGKSTLIHLLNGMHTPKSGTIEIDQSVIDSKTKIKSIRHIREQVAIVYQFTDLQLFAETVDDELKFAAGNFKIDMTDIDSRISQLFEVFNLDINLLTRSPFALSGGQKKKIAIITMLLINPRYLILDEPTVGLDPQSVIDILGAIDKLVDEGLRVIMISHDMNVINAFCNQIIELYNGKLIHNQSKYDYFLAKFIKREYLLLPEYAAFAASIDNSPEMYQKIQSGTKVSELVKERNV